MLLAAVAAGVADAERAREALAEVVRGRRLERLAVAHQRLERVGVDGAGEPLALALAPAQHGDGEDVLDRVGVDVVQDRQRLRDRLLPRSRAPCAPPARGTRSCAGRAAAAAPSGRRWPTGCRAAAGRGRTASSAAYVDQISASEVGPDGERLLELLAAGLGDERDLGREPFDELALLRQHRGGHEQREVEVLVPGRLDPVVELALDRLPDRVAVRLDHHRAAHGARSRRGRRGGRPRRTTRGSRPTCSVGKGAVADIGLLLRGRSTGRCGCGAPGRSGRSAYAGTCTNGGTV